MNTSPSRSTRPRWWARVKSVLRLKQLHDQVTEMNKNLEQRVADQLGEIERHVGAQALSPPRRSPSWC